MERDEKIIQEVVEDISTCAVAPLKAIPFSGSRHGTERMSSRWASIRSTCPCIWTSPRAFMTDLAAGTVWPADRTRQDTEQALRPCGVHAVPLRPGICGSDKSRDTSKKFGKKYFRS